MWYVLRYYQKAEGRCDRVSPSPLEDSAGTEWGQLHSLFQDNDSDSL